MSAAGQCLRFLPLNIICFQSRTVSRGTRPREPTCARGLEWMWKTPVLVVPLAASAPVCCLGGLWLGACFWDAGWMAGAGRVWCALSVQANMCSIAEVPCLSVRRLRLQQEQGVPGPILWHGTILQRGCSCSACLPCGNWGRTQGFRVCAPSRKGPTCIQRLLVIWPGGPIQGGINACMWRKQAGFWTSGLCME